MAEHEALSHHAGHGASRGGSVAVCVSGWRATHTVLALVMQLTQRISYAEMYDVEVRWRRGNRILCLGRWFDIQRSRQKHNSVVSEGNCLLVKVQATGEMNKHTARALG